MQNRADKVSDPAKAARYARSQYRSRQHESAHAEQNIPPLRIIEHPLIARDAGELIVEQSQLEEFLQHLRSEKSFAYDSEFIGELTYHPQLCLIQASTSKRIGLIDPLSDLDLKSFWELIADGAIEKIVHAGEQDLEPVHRLIGQPAANVFDTQVAAGFVGLAYPVGLSKLVGELLDVKLGKGLTFTHWDQRPLSAMQLRYAADDVRYLLAVRAELGQRLKKLAHEKWVRAECDSLCDPARLQFDAETDFLRIRGAGALAPQGLAVLRELMVWRDQTAQAHDVPPRAFLKDDILIDLARSPARSVERLDRVKGLPRPIEEAHGNEIVEATSRGLSIAPENRPTAKHHEPTPTERFGAESLYAALAAIAAGQQIDPALLASRLDIAELYRALSQKLPMPEIKLLMGWRREAAGEHLLELFAGKRQMELRWENNRLIAETRAE